MPSTPVETADAAHDMEMPFNPFPTPANQSLATTPVLSVPSNNVSSTTHATADLNSDQSGVPLCIIYTNYFHFANGPIIIYQLFYQLYQTII